MSTNRVLSASAQREFWYQSFHQLELAEALVDGNRAAVRSYLRHFWAHWSGPRYRQPEAALNRLAEIYSRPGAFTSSIGWYRAGSGTVASSLVETPPNPRERIASTPGFSGLSTIRSFPRRGEIDSPTSSAALL